MSKSKQFVVIGANGGIGSELCRRLVTEGHQVTLAGRDEAALGKLSEELDRPVEIVDATSIEQVESCLQRVAEASGSLDGVVNCAGSVLLKPAHLTSPDEWHSTIATNLTSAFATVRAAFRLMRKDGGSIVLLSTAAARTGIPNHEAIAAAKAGVMQRESRCCLLRHACTWSAGHSFRRGIDDRVVAARRE
jgi:NAD(P)-dependent dehydrogenase (short-subunit alcohol dehydrogenase family)